MALDLLCREKYFGVWDAKVYSQLQEELKYLEDNGIKLSDETVVKEPCIALLVMIWPLIAMMTSQKILIVHNICVNSA